MSKVYKKIKVTLELTVTKGYYKDYLEDMETDIKNNSHQSEMMEEEGLLDYTAKFEHIK